MSVALITGASRGIGAACAIALAEGGHDVAINYVHDQSGAEATAELVRGLGRSAVVLQADVRDEEAAGGLVAATEEALGPLDSLVLNAGVTRDGPSLRMTGDAWTDVIDTNLSGAFYTARPALRSMLRRRSGSIVAMSSIVGIGGNIGQANYAAAKAGMIGLVKALALESAARGVRVNAVAPGFIDTDMTSGLPEAVVEAFLADTPLGRAGTVQDVAAAVAFLCSPAASFITGTVLPVDGGRLLR